MNFRSESERMGPTQREPRDENERRKVSNAKSPALTMKEENG